MPEISIVTTCKGQLRHLKRALPFMLDQAPFRLDGELTSDYDVVVVDFGCPDGTFDWCSRQREPRLKCVGVNDQTDEFSINRAMNIGARFSTSPLLLFVDCDLLIGPDHLGDGLDVFDGKNPVQYRVENTADGNGPFYWHAPTTRDTQMACVSRIYPRALFEGLRGYDEGFRGWGWNDVDLAVRAELVHGAKPTVAPARLVFLNHTAEDSVRFFREKDKQKSAAENYARMQNYERDVNPGRWGVAGNDVRFHSMDHRWQNPNFINIVVEKFPEGRSDCQAGWHRMVGQMFQNRTILDVGSGLGHSKERMEVNGNRVTRYEPNPDCPSDTKLALWQFDDRSYDVVTAFDVLEHVARDENFIENLKRIARRAVFVSTPNIRVSGCRNRFHAREYTPEQLLELVGGTLYVSDARDGSLSRTLRPHELADCRSPVIGALWNRG